jgi:hypothetical protein
MRGIAAAAGFRSATAWASAAIERSPPQGQFGRQDGHAKHEKAYGMSSFAMHWPLQRGTV